MSASNPNNSQKQCQKTNGACPSSFFSKKHICNLLVCMYVCMYMYVYSYSYSVKQEFHAIGAYWVICSIHVCYQ